MSAPVDVLAVMRAEIKAIEANGEHEAAGPLLEARAAVAELIDAAIAVDATKGSTSPERIRLRLALARVHPMTREHQAEQAGVRG